MGDSEITLARYYALGAAGRLAMDTLPFTGAYTTYSVDERHPTLPDYVPDSAATGTAWATGHKTSNGRISTSAGTDLDMGTILEFAQSLKWQTGNVTTAELTDATPAVLAAHVSNRSCQGPADMTRCPQDGKSAGGPGSIAEQMIDHGVDVLLGGGAARFEQRPPDGSGSVLDAATRRGYRVVRTAAELNAAASTPVLGLFAAGNMSLEWNGLEASPYPGNVRSPQRCEEGRRPLTEPSLAEMTAKALALLGGASGTQNFFLQVEGASIDKQDHAANPCGQIGETIALDRTVKVGLDYARTHPDTLLIVTADHGHASQIVGIPTDADHPPGLVSVLVTADRAPIAVSYGTNGYHRSQDHTGTQVRIAAIGPQAASVTGVTDQTDLFRTMARAMGVDEVRTSAGR
jgi:alkaline phosphatase/streptomycin-6-phosphatase